jgi:hypothetical protein
MLAVADYAVWCFASAGGSNSQYSHCSVAGISWIASAAAVMCADTAATVLSAAAIHMLAGMCCNAMSAACTFL